MTSTMALPAAITTPRQTSTGPDKARKDGDEKTPSFASMMRPQRNTGQDDGRTAVPLRSETTNAQAETGAQPPSGEMTDTPEPARPLGLSSLQRRDWNAAFVEPVSGEEGSRQGKGTDPDPRKIKPRTGPSSHELRERPANSNLETDAELQLGETNAEVVSAQPRLKTSSDEVELKAKPSGKIHKAQDDAEAPDQRMSTPADAGALVTLLEKVARIEAMAARPTSAKTSADDSPASDVAKSRETTGQETTPAASTSSSRGLEEADAPGSADADVTPKSTSGREPARPAVAETAPPRQRRADPDVPAAAANAKANPVASAPAQPAPPAAAMVPAQAVAGGLREMAPAQSQSQPVAPPIQTAPAQPVPVGAHAEPAPVATPPAFAAQMTVAVANYALAAGKPADPPAASLPEVPEAAVAPDGDLGFLHCLSLTSRDKAC